MDISRTENPPDKASSNDRWVDTYDLNKIWLIHTAYDNEFVQSTLTIPSEDRPGAEPLVFEAQAFGNIGNNTYVKIVDMGATGTSTMTKEGTGTRSDPYIYTFNTYQDDNSNDSIIALLSSDLELFATGDDSDNGAVPDIDEQLDNGVMSNISAYQLVVRYKSIPPELVNSDSLIDESIPVNVRKLLADGLAAKMAMMNEGGGMVNRVKFWESKMNSALLKARENSVETTYPGSVRL